MAPSSGRSTRLESRPIADPSSVDSSTFPPRAHDHLCRTRLEDIEQIPVTTWRGSCCIELKNSADDTVGPSLIGWVEVGVQSPV